MLLDDAKNGGQPQTGAFAHLLGGEEGFKNPRQNFRRDAAAGVADAQTRKRTRSGLRGLRRGDFVKFDGGSFDDDLSALGHGVARIHRQIQQDLINHARIGMDDQWSPRKT